MTNIQQVILNMSRIFLSRIKVWSKILRKNFLTDSSVGLWKYKFKCNLLTNFSILQHNAWDTLQKCLSFQYEPGRRLLLQSQQLENVGNMFTVNNEDTGATPLSSCLILNSFQNLFFCLSSYHWTGSF